MKKLENKVAVITGARREDQVSKKRFRDRTFTELVEKGHTPNANFDDYTLIGSGKLEEVSREGAW